MSVMKLFDIKGLGVTDDTEKQFKEGGFEFLEARTFADIIKERTGGSLSDYEVIEAKLTFAEVRVEIAIPDSVTTVPDFSVRIGQRTTGREVYFTNFGIYQNGPQRVVGFTAHMPMPAEVLRVEQPPKRGKYICTSFLDLCYGGATEISNDGSDSPTLVREGAVYADIGWMMPSRFTDTLIDTIGKINDALFDGGLRESMIYWEI